VESLIINKTNNIDGSRHLIYQLTEKGQALLPVVKAMKDWGLAWEKGSRASLTLPNERNISLHL
jgi:DNA-binding HxlR family transcriptional regulator